MSITSTRLAVSLGVVPLLMLSCQELNPEFCTDHPGGAVCFAKGSGRTGWTGLGAGDRGIDDVRCTSNAQCASPTPICDMTRSMCVQRTAAASSARDGATPMCGDNIGPVPQHGTNNLACDSQSVDPAHSDFHFQVTSPARSTANPTATLANDIDGEIRPQGPGREMGADEIK